MKAGKMERHVHIAQEMDQELQSFFRRATADPIASIPPVDQSGDVPYACEDVDIFLTVPSSFAGELGTALRWVVFFAADEVELGRPEHRGFPADLVGPRSDGRKMTVRVLGIGVENRADGG
jgi:hypothetical protein